MIDVTLLGTAALMPLPERALTAAALTCAGHTLLFDCGEGTQTAARRARVSLMKIDGIALTHYHGDHIFGLPGLLQTLGSLGRVAPLWIAGPADIAQALAPVLLLAERQPYEIRLLTLPPEGLALDECCGWPAGAQLSAFPTEHRVPSQGYVFTLPRSGKFLPERARALGVPVRRWGDLQRGLPVEADGRLVPPEAVLGPARPGLKFVFSGDTSACPALENAARDADLLICEATYGENEQAQMAGDYGHMNFAQAGALAARAGCKRLWLAHYSQMVKEPADYLDNTRAYFPEAECGADGMALTLRFPEEACP